jgi:hypothetical protein
MSIQKLLKHELERCPLCREVPVLVEHQSYGNSFYTIECDCGLQLIGKSVVEDVVKQWNKREEDLE